MYILLIVFLIILLGLYCLYRYVFGTDARRVAGDDEIPYGARYQKYQESVTRNIREFKAAPYEEMRIIARDGTKLFGRCFHMADGGPVILMFHGYRSSAYRDAMGAFQISRACGYNLLVVDQRAHHGSGGRTITFGVKERYDCLDWIAFVTERFGKETKIFLVGLSMGASTVLMAAGLELPDSVKGIMADCGYSTPKDILCSVIQSMRLPIRPVYFLIRLSAIIFGGFDPNSASAHEALKKCKIPVLFIHGEADSLVPCEMGKTNYEVCAGKKEMFLVAEADHGMSYLHDAEKYLEVTRAFIKRSFEE